MSLNEKERCNVNDILLSSSLSLTNDSADECLLPVGMTTHDWFIAVKSGVEEGERLVCVCVCVCVCVREGGVRSS